MSLDTIIEFMKRRWASIALVGVTVISGLGHLIRSMHLQGFGIHMDSFLQPTVALTGTLWLLWASFPIVVSVVVLLLSDELSKKVSTKFTWSWCTTWWGRVFTFLVKVLVILGTVILGLHFFALFWNAFFFVVLFDTEIHAGEDNWLYVFPSGFEVLYGGASELRAFWIVVVYTAMVLALIFWLSKQKEKPRSSYDSMAPLRYLLVIAAAPMSLLSVVLSVFSFVGYIYPLGHQAYGGGKPRMVDVFFHEAPEAYPENSKPLGILKIPGSSAEPQFDELKWSQIYLIHETSSDYFFSTVPAPYAGARSVRIPRGNVKQIDHYVDVW